METSSCCSWLHRWARRVVLSWWLLALCAALAQATVDGSIHGRVTDRNGAALRGAEVEVRNQATNAAASMRTDEQGSFHADHLAPGTYRVQLQSEGFQRYVAQNVMVQLGRATELHPQLAVGGGVTTITVQAGPGATQLDSSAFASNVLPGEIGSLPVEGRRWSMLALLSPGAEADASGDGQLSFRGLSPALNNYTVDGLENNRAFSPGPIGGHHIAYGMSQGAVREFQVNISNYSARFGWAAGGAINTVTRSGSNARHGSLVYAIRDNALAAMNPFDQISVFDVATGMASSRFVKPQDVRQQWGGALGGALVRNRLFYFYSYDQLHRNFPAVAAPLSTTFFQDVNYALLANRGLSAAQTNAALGYISNLTGTMPRQAEQNINFLRLDWQANNHNHLNAQYNRLRWNSPGGVHATPVVHAGATSLGNDVVKTDTGIARWLMFVTDNVSNDLRYADARDFEAELAQRPAPQEPATGPDGLPPQVSFGYEGIQLGTPATQDRYAYPDERRQQLSDVVSWSRGGNNVHAGVSYSHVREYSNFLRDREGSYSYRYSSNGVEDWITDYTRNAFAYPTAGCQEAPYHYFCFSDYTQGFGPGVVRFATTDYAAFVQSNWKLRRNLTMNFGVRYEYEQLPAPQHPNAALDAAFSDFGSTSHYAEDRNNYGPRIGFSWAPWRRSALAIRAGYGVYYSRILNATIRSALMNTAVTDVKTGLPRSDFYIRITPKTVTSSTSCMNSGIATFGYPCTFPTYPRGNTAHTTTAAVLFGRHFQAPMVQQFHLSVQRELSAKTMVSASYLMSLNRQLANAVDVNIAPATGMEQFQLQGAPAHARQGVLNGETFVVPVYTERRNAQFGPVAELISNASGSYNALVLRAEQRMTHGVQLHAQWTWAKALDFGQSASAGYRGNHQFDPFNIRYDKGLSNYNRPHRVLVSVVFAPRVHLENPSLQKALRNWELAAIFVEVSGRPYSYNISGGSSLAGGYRSINGSGGAVYLPTVGRNTLRMPDMQNLDVRLARSFVLGAARRLTATIDGFNLLNHVTYSGLVTTAYRPGTKAEGSAPNTLIFQDANAIEQAQSSRLPFGQYTSGGNSQYHARQVQIALRLEF